MKDPLIQFKHASLGYGRYPVLSGVNLSIEPGAFVGILGPNGAGKSTWLKALLGLIPCQKGHVACREDLRFGYVPQKERLDPIYPLSAQDVAGMGTYRRFRFWPWKGRKDRRELVGHCLNACGASLLSHRPYSDLSGGQKQRVLLARALVTQPEVLALDEPLAGIDITTQKSLLRLLKQFKDEGKLTILMVSHRVQAERGLFSHIIWCDEGQAVMGPAEDMLAKAQIGDIFKSEL